MTSATLHEVVKLLARHYPAAWAAPGDRYWRNSGINNAIGPNGQFGLGARRASRLPAQHAKTEVAMGDEWAHGQLFGQRHGLTVEVFGLLEIPGACPDFAQAAEGPGLISTLPPLTEDLKGLPDTIMRLFQAAGQPIRLPQPGNPKRMPRVQSTGAGLLDGLVEKRQPFGGAASQCERVPEMDPGHHK